MNELLLKEIERLKENLKVNSYSHGEFIFDEKSGIYQSNCTEIIKYLLGKLRIPLEGNKAYKIYDNIQASEYFKEVSYTEAMPGDIIIWRKNNIPSRGSTGHLAILISKISEGKIKVFDCVKEPHSCDSRINGGIGEGEMQLILKDRDVKGFVWSDIKKKTKFTRVLIFRPVSKS